MPSKKYRIQIKIALLDNIDYAVANNLTELFWRLKKDVKNNTRKIRSLSSKITIGNKATFWNGKRDYLKSKIRPLTPVTNHETKNNYIVYYFKNPPQLFGINFAEFEIETEITSIDILEATKGNVKNSNRRTNRELIKRTHFWPVGSKPINSLRKELDIDGLEKSEQVIWIHHWIKSNIKGYPGPSKRLGVVKTLNTRRGNCWEVSDLFVTLCRAYGIPARQLGGWLYKKGQVSAGHAWAEVYLENQGWIPIDALRKSLRIPDYYIPYFASDDGELPVVYFSMPRVVSSK